MSREVFTSTGESWRPVNIAAVLAGDLSPLEPTILARPDGLRLLYPGRVNAFIGEPESCKSFAAQIAAAEVLRDGGTVWYLDFESEARDVAGHLLAFGVSKADIVKGLVYVRPDEPIGGAVELLHSQRDSHLTIVDGVNSALVANGWEPNSNRDVADFHAQLIRPLQLITDGPLVTIDHVVKDRQTRGDWAVGAGQKKALVDGAMLAFEIVHPFGRGRTGLIKILVFKDRPGALRGQAVGKEIARLQLVANAEGDQITYELGAPAADQSGGFRPTVLMERISRFLEAMPNALSTRAILDGVPGKGIAKQAAIRVLAAEGYLRCSPGPRGGLMYESVKAFFDRVPTVSHRVRGHSEDDCVPVSPLLTEGDTGHGHSGSISSNDRVPVLVAVAGKRCPDGHHCSQSPNGSPFCCGRPLQ